MKLDEYINSGILEEFAMGLLNEVDAEKVGIRAQKHPEIRKELELIQRTLEKIDQDTSVVPSLYLKTQIMNSLEGESMVSNTEVVSKSSFNFKYAFAASITGFMIACTVAFYLGYQLNQSEKELQALSSELAESNTSLAVVNKSFENYLSIAGSNHYAQIALNGLENFPNAGALAYRGNGKVYVSLGNLPTPPANMQYQFWAIVEGVPVNAGLIGLNLKSGQLTELSDFENADAFAISLEEVGGKKAPTSDQIYVLGKV